MDITLSQVTCASCHVIFWLASTHKDKLVATKETFYCPAGHAQNYTGKPDAEKAKEAEQRAKMWERYYDQTVQEKNKLENQLKTCQRKLKKPKKVK